MSEALGETEPNVWRNPTIEEWQLLKDSLDTNEPWTDDQWRVASGYLEGQYEHNLRSLPRLSEETFLDPFTPDRFLHPQAQEIQRLAINQVSLAFGITSEL